MRRFIIIGCLVLAGCVPLTIRKQVQVEVGPDGKVIKTIYTEEAIQQATTVNTVSFDYLKNKATDAQPIQTYDASSSKR
jgi:hypothetical protein